MDARTVGVVVPTPSGIATGLARGEVKQSTPFNSDFEPPFAQKSSKYLDRISFGLYFFSSLARLMS